MKVMVVDTGHASELYFLCQALQSLGAEIIHSPSLDQDRVLIHKVDAVVYVWSGFIASQETVQIQSLKDADPTVVMAIFARPEDVPALRRRWPRDLVADQRALEERFAEGTAEAMIREVRARRPQAVAPSTPWPARSA